MDTVLNDHATDFEDSRPLSAAAVTSLVLGLLCCVPGIGLIGVVLGAIGIAATGPTGSRRGRGVAVSGVVISGLALVLQLVVIILAWMGWASFVAPAMVVVEDGPNRTLQAAFTDDPVAFDADWMSGSIPSEADRKAFVEGVRLVLGDFESATMEPGSQPPVGGMGGASQVFELGYRLRFENGAATAIVRFRASRQGETTAGGSYLGLDAITVETADGKVFSLPVGEPIEPGDPGDRGDLGDASEAASP